MANEQIIQCLQRESDQGNLEETVNLERSIHNTNNARDDQIHTQQEQSSQAANTMGDLPIVDRLPSRNVSFQSAEILTIPELSKVLHNSPNSFTFQGKVISDVRATGVILHMFMGKEGECLILGDALFVPNVKRSNPLKATRGRNSGSALAISSRKPVSTSLSSLASSSASDTTGTSLLGQKRRLISVQPRNRGRGILGNTLSPAMVQFRNRNSITSPRHTKEELDVIKKSRQGMNMIVVDISKMSTIDGCNVGDLVMVIGSTFRHSLPSESKTDPDAMAVNGMDRKQNLDHTMSHGLTRIVELVGRHHPRKDEIVKHEIQDKGTDNNNFKKTVEEESGSNMSCGYVEARIIRVVNGTDMNLLQEALKIRRQLLNEYDM